MAEVGVGEDCADQVRHLLLPAQRSSDLGPEFGRAVASGDAGPPDAVVLDVLPQQFEHVTDHSGPTPA